MLCLCPCAWAEKDCARLLGTPWEGSGIGGGVRRRVAGTNDCLRECYVGRRADGRAVRSRGTGYVCVWRSHLAPLWRVPGVAGSRAGAEEEDEGPADGGHHQRRSRAYGSARGRGARARREWGWGRESGTYRHRWVKAGVFRLP